MKGNLILNISFDENNTELKKRIEGVLRRHARQDLKSRETSLCILVSCEFALTI